MTNEPSSRAPYRILFGKNAKKWRSVLPATKHRVVERLIREQLAVKPFERIPGKTKMLKGSHKGVVQYNIDDNFRVHYTVDDAERIVRILYIGPHPDW